MFNGGEVIEMSEKQIADLKVTLFNILRIVRDAEDEERSTDELQAIKTIVGGFIIKSLRPSIYHD